MAQSWPDSEDSFLEDGSQSYTATDSKEGREFFIHKDSEDPSLATSRLEDESSLDSLAGSSSPGASSSTSRRPSDPSPESATSRSRSAVEEMATAGLWVFGYGSLCWHQGFDYTDSMTGFVTGFSRRFWQGNVTHRGTDGKPGRVATLVEDNEEVVWGKAFKVRGEAAMPYLNNRECELGGYRTTLASFYPKDRSIASFPAVLYVATPNNRHWLGEGPLPSIADQIVSSEGPSGHNVEYLLRLADFLREQVPEAADDHLFGLEALVRDRVQEKKLCLRTLMGEMKSPAPIAFPAFVEPPAAPVAPAASTQFSNRVPTKKLRCVNI